MKYIPAIILGLLAGICFLCAKPTEGGVNANAIMIVPAAFFAFLTLIAFAAAWFV